MGGVGGRVPRGEAIGLLFFFRGCRPRPVGSDQQGPGGKPGGGGRCQRGSGGSVPPKL